MEKAQFLLILGKWGHDRYNTHKSQVYRKDIDTITLSKAESPIYMDFGRTSLPFCFKELLTLHQLLKMKREYEDTVISVQTSLNLHTVAFYHEYPIK